MRYIGGMTHSSFQAVVHLIRAHALVEERFAGELAAVHGLALKEALLLMHLNSAPLTRLSRIDLAKRLSVSPSTVTRTTMPLEKLGLVDRMADARDARLAYVVLTESGKALLANAVKTIDSMSVDLFRDRWSKQDIAQLSQLLGRMTAGLPGDLG
jgi:DNA-binding MarR family transcriptional regulator